MIEKVLDQLLEDCEYLFTSDQIDHIKRHMAGYALAAIMNTKVSTEVVVLIEEYYPSSMEV